MRYLRKYRNAFILLALALSLSACSRKEIHPELKSLLREEFQRRPKATAQDVYKLLYQGEFGVSQILHTPSAAKEYLILEAASQPKTSDVPLIEACSADGKVIRVNLRPFISKNLSLDSLFLCMAESAEQIHGSRERMKRIWQHVGELVDRDEAPIPKSAYEAMCDTLTKYSFPAMHHSREYTLAYRPSYRVVLRSVFEKYFRTAH